MTERLRRFAAAALLLWMLGAGLFLAHQQSLTTDEGIHVASGYLIITRHDYRFDPEHPPLFKFFTALPLVIMHPNLPPDDQKYWQAAQPTFYDSWQEARNWTEEWFYKSGNNTDKMVFWMRVPAVLFMVLLGYLVWRLGSLWFGSQVGLLALFFTAFNPTLLVHGSLANDDVPVVVGMLLTLWAIWCYWRNPRYSYAIASGIMLGITIGTKFNGLALGLAFVIAYLIIAFSKTHQAWRTIGHMFLGLLGTWLIVWLMYSFQSPVVIDSHLPILLHQIDRHHSINPAQAETAFRILAKLFPSAFLKGIAIVEIGTVGGRATYLLGQHYGQGVWYYFPIVFFLKTQLIVLPILLTGLLLSRKTSKPPYILLALAFCVFMLTALTSKLDLGIRHITPVLTIISFYLALSCMAIMKSVKAAWILPLILLCYSVPVIWQLPTLLGYVSEAVQPPESGWKYMADSNLDWGQNAKEIAYVMRTQFPGQTLYTTGYNWSPYALDYYGVKTQIFDVDIIPHQVPILLNSSDLADEGHKRFRTMEPVAHIGNSDFFYYLP